MSSISVYWMVEEKEESAHFCCSFSLILKNSPVGRWWMRKSNRDSSSHSVRRNWGIKYVGLRRGRRVSAWSSALTHHQHKSPQRIVIAQLQEYLMSSTPTLFSSNKTTRHSSAGNYLSYREYSAPSSKRGARSAICYIPLGLYFW